MKLKNILDMVNEEKELRAGLLPYTIKDQKFYFAFMIPSDPKYGGDKPQISKGHVDVGENFLQAAIREAKEELGYVHKSNHRIKPVKGITGNIHWFYVKINSIDEFRNPGIETKKVVWLDIGQSFKKIRSWQRPILSKVFQEIKNQ